MHLRFSQDIKALLDKLACQPLTVGDILAETVERGFSLMIGLLVLPFLVPMPPGLTVIFGSACLLLSGQMVFDRQTPWLPRNITQIEFPRHLATQILNLLKRLTRILERFVRPRWPQVAENRYVWRINGLCISWLVLLLMLPIPLTNPLPTVGILLFAIAMLEADGLLMCVGYGLTLVITVLFGSIAYLLWHSPTLIDNFLK